MNTKFNIGDRVSYVSGVGGDETVFEIIEIRIKSSGIFYTDYDSQYSESYSTLYIEPKKKVIKYLWAYQSIARSVHGVTCNFYADESELKKDHRTEHYAFFKRLDWSATEFEGEL